MKFFLYLERFLNMRVNIKKDNLDPDSIVKIRKRDQIPIKNELYKLIFDTSYKPNSSIYAAVKYVKDIWDDMWTYIENGYLEPSNNIAERAVKPFVIQRKVFQTSGSYAGARYTSKLFSIIQTARANNLDTYQYLNFLLENIKNKEISIESLLPYSNEMRKKFSNKLCES